MAFRSRSTFDENGKDQEHENFAFYILVFKVCFSWSTGMVDIVEFACHLLA